MKKTIALGIILFVGIGVIPFETTFVAHWRVRLIDEQGRPYTGLAVGQYCTSVWLGERPCAEHADAAQVTDDNGYVTFPRRTIRASLLYRILRSVATFFLMITTGEYKDYGQLAVTGPHGPSVIEFEPASPPDQIVLPSN